MLESMDEMVIKKKKKKKKYINEKHLSMLSKYWNLTWTANLYSKAGQD